MLIENKLNGESFDIVDDNISKLKELFPEIVNGDNEVDIGALIDIFEKNGDVTVDDSEEHYKFTWWGKKQSKRVAKETTTKTLRPSKKDSKNWDTTKNIYIEGDNLDALKILLGTYRDSIKMIYIDPPYNTGHDFVYKDDRTESTKEHLESTGQLSEEGFLYENAKTDGKYHSNWLNMMYPRLVLARKLLRNDGVIFISIDDNEVENLKKICNEIFGEVNFLSNIIWQSRTSISNDQPISLNHNHTLVYCKNINSLSFGGEPLDITDYDNPDNDPRGPWKLVPIDANKAGGNTVYPIVNPYTNEEYYPPNGRIWAYNPEEYKKLYEDGRIKFGKNDTSSPKKKLYYYERIERGDRKTPSSLLTSVGTTKNGTTEIMELFDNKKIFNYPKPTSLISKLIDYAIDNYKNSEIILDFFSGSGTTAVSVIKNNLHQNSNLSFIMVQIPEPTDEKSITYKEGYENICEIGKERIRRAGDKIVEESGNTDLDIGFKVFKIDESNFIPWNPVITSENVEQAILSTADNLVQGRSELDLVYELLLKLNMDLNCPIEETNVNGNKVYVVDNGYLLICLENKLDASIADDLLNLKEELMVDYSQVILKDNALNDNSAINIYETLESNGVEFYTL